MTRSERSTTPNANGPSTAYRAAARRWSAGDAASSWHGRWHPDRGQAEAQAVRWKFETERPPEVVWLEQLVAGQAVTVAVLLEVVASQADTTDQAHDMAQTLRLVADRDPLGRDWRES